MSKPGFEPEPEYLALRSMASYITLILLLIFLPVSHLKQKAAEKEEKDKQNQRKSSRFRWKERRGHEERTGSERGDRKWVMELAIAVPHICSKSMSNIKPLGKSFPICLK